jgi:hypothetical protein
MNRAGISGLTGASCWALAALLLALPAHGQSKKVKPAKPDYSASYAGVALVSQGQTYELLAGVHAVLGHPAGREPVQALANLGLPNREVMETKGSLIIYRESPVQDAGVLALSTAPKAVVYPVAVNTRTGQLGVVLGNLLVTLKEAGTADDMALANRVTIAQRFDHLKLIVVKAGPGEDLQALADQLTADARVRRVEIEVVENVNVPQ